MISVEENLGLARFLAWKYYRKENVMNRYTYDDILSQSYYGLVMACKYFNQDKGGFGVYAYNMISGYIFTLINQDPRYRKKFRDKDGTIKIANRNITSLDEPMKIKNNTEGSCLLDLLESSVDDYEQLEERECMDYYLNKIKPAYKQALKMYYFDELSQLEIANKLGVSRSSITRRLRYGLCKLKEVIKKENSRYYSLLSK